MANICNYTMRIAGKKENRMAFLKALSQVGKYAIGRGAVVTRITRSTDRFCTVEGWLKWSVKSSLIDCAESMQRQKNGKNEHWMQSFIEKYEFLTIEEAVDKFQVDVEIYSEEPGCAFAEHYTYEHDEDPCYEETEFKLLYLPDYESYEEFIEDYPGKKDEISKEEFELLKEIGADEYVLGGFPDKEFWVF